MTQGAERTKYDYGDCVREGLVAGGLRKLQQTTI